MLGRNIVRLGMCIVLAGVHSIAAQPPRSPRAWHHGPRGHGGRGHVRGGGWPIFLGFGTTGLYAPVPPILFVNPAMFFPPTDWNIGQPMMGGGPLLAPPPQGLVGPGPAANNPPAGAKRSDPARSNQLITVGDRLFRAGNHKRAEERYQQALRAAPDRAAPYARLAQIAIARGNYADAADRLRQAESAEPGWIITAADIQSIYAEPTAFAQTVSRLESHLQVHPDDRDAWLVLGAQWFLSGRTAKAADVFHRLNDPKRKSDVALSAFLDASNQERDKASKPGDRGGDPLR
jgi:cytochrome c-type biogenesis protein CcmH/NrfG